MYYMRYLTKKVKKKITEKLIHTQRLGTETAKHNYNKIFFFIFYKCLNFLRLFVSFDHYVLTKINK